MLRQFRKTILPGLVGVLLSFPLSLSAATELNIADVPLSVISSVPPNVMLLLDDSGSMNNVVWYQGDNAGIPAYDTTATYDPWCDNCSGGNRWDPADPNIALDEIPAPLAADNCGTPDLSPVSIPNASTPSVPYTVNRYLVAGRLGSETKCLVLPDIRTGGNTWYAGHYLNYLFHYFTDGQDLTKIIPFKTRMMVMQEVTTDLISSTPGMNFGVTVFNNGNGGDVLAGCTRDNSIITEEINRLTSGGSTPLAESMYEVTRYFRNMRPYYRSRNDFDNPIKYSCQKNFVIAVTDGLPTSDGSVDTDDPDIATYCPSGTCSLPNWDQLNTSPRFSDSGTLYFDDIVKFAYDVDMKTGPGFDDDPFAIQNIETYAVGFSIANQMLRDAGHYGSGRTADQDEDEPPTNYFTADDESQLKDDLEAALNRIEGKSGSAASVAASTGFIGAGTSLYQGLFDTNNWTGNLKRYDLSIDTDRTVTIAETDIDAASKLIAKLSTTGGAAGRNIISYNPDLTPSGPGQGIDFNWSSLSSAQKTYLANREEILDFIRGDQRCEITSSGTCDAPKTRNLRDRGTNGEGLLGTIVNSTPIYIAKPIEYYPAIWKGTNAPENIVGAEKHYDFKDEHKARQAMVYVGANDGMLHIFDADSLEEVMAYIPNAVYPKLADLADQNHTHKYYVDGTPTVIDAFFGSGAPVGGDNKWHTILAGGLNRGGQGIYALDITDPNKFTGANAKNSVLWEFTHDNDRDLGYSFSRPSIVRMHNGIWAAVFGNGYNNTEIDDGDTNGDGITDINDDTGDNDSQTGNAVLYIVNLRTGELILKIDTEIGSAQDPTGKNRPNGLATVAPVDIDDDFIIDYIYAGDLFGNLWRFDVTGSDPGTWKIFGKGSPSNPDPIFVAHDSNGIPQPITSRPDAAITDAGGLMIYFGTGQYIQLSDISNKDVQSFYGLLDNPENDKRSPDDAVQKTRAKMIQQTINAEATYSSGQGTETVRQFSKNASTDNYASWYIDLIVEGGSPEGERVIGAPIVRGVSSKKIVFTSIIPTQDICDFGGRSWLMELDARNGNLTTTPVFDLNFDGKLDKQDNGNGKDVFNGWSQKGIMTSPAILKDKIEYKILSGSTGVLRAVGEAPDAEQEGARQSWRQIK